MQICEVFASLNCFQAIWTERSGVVYMLLYSYLKDDEERSDEELSPRHINSAKQTRI